MNTCSIGAHFSGHVALSKHPVFCCRADCLTRYGSTLRALMTIGSSCYACRNRQGRESKPCRRYWSFFISKKSGLPIRVGRRRGRVLSNGSTACDRSSPGVPIAAFVWAPSALARPRRERTRRFLNSSIGHSGTALPARGTSFLFWLIGSRLKGFEGSCAASSAVGRVRAPPKKSDRECRLAERRQEAMKLCWILVSSAPHSFYSFGCETRAGSGNRSFVAAFSGPNLEL